MKDLLKLAIALSIIVLTITSSSEDDSPYTEWTWSQDVGSDGFGDPDVGQIACVQPEG